jgi:hypothetical protein
MRASLPGRRPLGQRLAPYSTALCGTALCSMAFRIEVLGLHLDKDRALTLLLHQLLLAPSREQ